MQVSPLWLAAGTSCQSGGVSNACRRGTLFGSCVPILQATIGSSSPLLRWHKPPLNRLSWNLTKSALLSALFPFAGTHQAALPAAIRWVVDVCTSNVLTTGSLSSRCRTKSWIFANCSRWYCSASALLFQMLMPRIRLGSASETNTISSTKPRCFFRIGIAFSSIVTASSLDFPDLQVSSTTRVNTLRSFLWLDGERNPPRARRRVLCCGQHHVTPIELAGSRAVAVQLR